MAQMQKVEILMVEDSTGDAEMTLRALRRHNLGNKVHWVRDGAQALDFLFGNGPWETAAACVHPRLILLDINMPRVNGIEVLRLVKADERLRVIPVVVMTSSNEESDVIESYRLGVNSYIVKPIEFGAFAEVVAKIGLYWVLANRVPA